MLFLVIKAPKRRWQSVYNTFLMHVEAPSRKAAIEKAMRENRTFENNVCDDRNEYQKCKARPIEIGESFVLP